MKVPESFFKFQSLVTESTALSEVGNELASGESTSREKSLSYLCDTVLASLHSKEEFRDAVVDSRANLEDNAILLILNGELEDEMLSEMAKFVLDVDGVIAVGFGKRKHPQDNEEVRVMKIKGAGQDCSNEGDKDRSNSAKETRPNVAGPMEPMR